MFKKYLSTISTTSLLILGVSLLSITPQSVAYAAAPNVPVCADVPDYTNSLKANPKYNKSTIGFVVFKRDWNVSPYFGNPILSVVWDVNSYPGKLKITDGQDATHVAVSQNDPAESYVIKPDGTLTPFSSLANSKLLDANCVSAAHKVNFTGYTGGKDFPDPLNSLTGEFDTPPSVSCDWYNLVCVTQKLYSSVTNGFKNITTSLENGITDIVGPILEALIPGADNNSIFSDMFNGLKSGLETKLGFLTYPFSWFGDFFSNIQSISWSAGFAPSCIGDGTGVWSHCYTSFKVWQGQSVTIYWGVMEKRLPQLWNVCIIFVRFTFLIAIIEMLRRAYFRTVKA